MKIRKKYLPTVCCISLLSACMSNGPVKEVQNTSSPMSTTNLERHDAVDWYKRGLYYQGKNLFDLAIKAYQKVLATDMGFAEALNGLGVIYSKQKRYSEAEAAFQEAIQQAPKATHLFSNMGYSFYLQGEYDKSIVALKKALLLDPANDRAVHNLNLVYAKKSNVIGSAQLSDQVLIAQTPFSTSSHEAALPNLQRDLTSSDNVAADLTNKSEELPAQVVLQSEGYEWSIPDSRSVVSKVADGDVISLRPHIQLMEVEPHVSELRIQPYDVTPIQSNSLRDGNHNERSKIEVANGNGVTGLAGKVGQFLMHQGYSAVRLTNQKPFQVAVTLIQYREGHQAQAWQVWSSFSKAPEPVQINDLRKDISVRLVLGKNFVSESALYNGFGPKFLFARRNDAGDS